MYNGLYNNRRDQVWNVLKVLGETGATLPELREDIRLDGIRKGTINVCIDFLVAEELVVIDGERDVVTLGNRVYRNRPVYKAVADKEYYPKNRGSRDRINDMSPWITTGWALNRSGIPVLLQQKGSKTRKIHMVYDSEVSRKTVAKATKRSGLILAVDSPVEQPQFNIGTQLEAYKSNLTTSSLENNSSLLERVHTVSSAYSQLAG